MKKKKLMAVLLSAALLLGTGSTFGMEKIQASDNVMAEIYVSPQGSAGGSGAKGDPVATLEQARDLVRTMNQDMTGDILVYFGDGEYFMESVTEFNEIDSGTNDHQIIYTAEPGCSPVFTSGERITGWTDAGDAQHPDMVKAEVPTVENTRQLYINGVLATRAKGAFPGNIQRAGDYETYETYNGTHKAYYGYNTDAKAMENWRNISDIEFIYDILWVHRIVPVESITALNEQQSYIKMHWESFRLSQFAGGTQVHADVPSYIENAYELLDEPGEWYFDRNQRVIYYIPHEGQEIDQVEAVIPRTEQFITVHGQTDQKVRNISFQRLHFQYNTWLYPSDSGWPDQQANFAHDPRETENMHGYSVTPLAAVETGMSENISFIGCEFRNIGSGAISILKGSVGNIVAECVFKEISAGGVLIGGVNITDAHPIAVPEDASLDEIKQALQEHADDPAASPHDERLIVKDNEVTNCYFNEIGTEYKGSVAVLAGYTDGTKITNNTIKNVAYSGISVGWGWGFWDQTGRAESVEAGEITPEWYPIFPEGDAAVSRNNIIEYNDVGSCMTKMHDGGGIYTLGDMPGSSISYNSIHDMASWPGGLYLDEGSGGMTVAGNITYNTPYTCFYNIREFTWGHREDQPVFGENYWNTPPRNPSYPHDLAAKIGISSEMRERLPKELDRVLGPDYVAAGDELVLEGSFGDEPGKVVLTGVNGDIELDTSSKYLISWTAEQIVILVPGGVTSGPIYVVGSNGISSNTNHRISVPGGASEVFGDDFESYQTGLLKGQEAAENKYTYLHERISIAEEDGNKILKMTSDGTDTYLEKTADWEDLTLSFDFRMDTPIDGAFGGVTASPRHQQKGVNSYLVNMLPNFGDGFLYQSYVNGSYGSPGGTAMDFGVDIWYSLKLEMISQTLKVRIWEKGQAEPSEWTDVLSYEGLSNGEITSGGLLLQYVNNLGADTGFVSFDNISVKIFEGGVTEYPDDDENPPVTTAEISGQEDSEGSYINQARITLTAEDPESGVSSVSYRVNGEAWKTYKAPVLVSKEGDFEVEYRARDRAGNREESKSVSGKISAGKIIFTEDFESYQSGIFSAYQEAGYGLTDPEKFFIEPVAEGGQALKIEAKENTALRLTKAGQWEDTIMTLDFKYKEELNGIEGLYISNYYQGYNPDNMHVYPVIPGYGGIMLQQNVNGQAKEAAWLRNEDVSLRQEKWHHMKVRTSSELMAVKVWQEGQEEPAEWMAIGSVSGLTGGGGLHLGFAPGGKSANFALYDNIRITAFEEDTEDQDSAAAVAALISEITAVEYTPECREQISAARAAYEALSDSQKDLVENYDDLLEAERQYEKLEHEAALEAAKAEAEAAKKAAEKAQEEAERAKAQAEIAKAEAEAAKADAKKEQAAKKAAEEKALQAEKARAAAEKAKKTAEEKAAKAEKLADKITFTNKKVSLKKVKSSRRKTAKVTWKKVSGARGYIVQYAQSAKFKKARSIDIRRSSTTSRTIKKLRSRKKYYFRVRAYKLIDGKRVYTKYSNKRSVRVK